MGLHGMEAASLVRGDRMRHLPDPHQSLGHPLRSLRVGVADEVALVDRLCDFGTRQAAGDTGDVLEKCPGGADRGIYDEGLIQIDLHIISSLGRHTGVRAPAPATAKRPLVVLVQS